MIIFSLQTKKHLLGWSMGLGLMTNFIINYLTAVSKNLSSCSPSGVCTQIYGSRLTNFGFPFVADVHDANNWWGFIPLEFWYNLLFWFFGSLIILSLIRYFRYRKAGFPSRLPADGNDIKTKAIH